LAVLLVNSLAPQPQWQSVDVFARHYHPVQWIPYLFGFILIGGLLLLVAGHVIAYWHAREWRMHLVMAMALATVFFTLIFFNYIAQLVFIPNLMANPDAGDHGIIRAFTMTNPHSLSWVLEMWGYAILATGLYLLVPCYANNYLTRLLLAGNLVMSLAGALWMMIDVQWLITPTGLLLYGAWNLLLLFIMVRMAWLHKDLHKSWQEAGK
jgi:hypothetical protein